VWKGGIRVLFWFLVGTFLLLTWLGSCSAEEPFNFAAQLFRVVYFAFFFVLPVWRNWVRLGVWVNL